VGSSAESSLEKGEARRDARLTPSNNWLEGQLGADPGGERCLVRGCVLEVRVERDVLSRDVAERGQVSRLPVHDRRDAVERVVLIDGEDLAVVGDVEQVEGEAEGGVVRQLVV